MAARIGAMSCHCCGELESTGGCVRGLRCGCDSRSQCDLCRHCDDHHVEGCTEALRTEFDILMMTTASDFRKKHGINVFGQPANVERIPLRGLMRHRLRY